MQAVYPVLLDDFPSPVIRTYPVYTVIAEKLHAIALLGMTNTRLKDYLDLHVLLDREVLNMTTLAHAVAATFTRRGIAVPGTSPIGLTVAFASDPTRQALWLAFQRKNSLPTMPLSDLLDALRDKVEPVLRDAANVTPPATQETLWK